MNPEMKNANVDRVAEQEVKRLYAVTLHYYKIGEITEYFVVKETPKTYVVTDDPKMTAKWWQNTVKKSDMEVSDRHFCESYEEALVFKKDILTAHIAKNERRIVELTKENDRCRTEIKAAEDGLLTLRGGGDVKTS